MITNPAIKPYTLKNGKTRYFFKIYLGVDPLTGKEKTTTRRSFTTPKQAQLAYDRLKYQFKNNQYLQKQRKTYKDVFEEWIEKYKISGIEMSTFDKTEGYFRNHILPYFEEYKIDKITVKVCEDFALQLSKKLKHFRHIVNYANDVMDTALRYGYIINNPFQSAKIPKEKKKLKSDNYFLRQEINLFLNYLKGKDLIQYVFFRLMIFTGMRKGEMFALNWADLNFDDNKLSINKALSYSKEKKRYLKETKSNENRTIFLDDETISILKQWKEQQSKELLILGHKEKSPHEQLIFNDKNNKFLPQNKPNTWLKEIITNYNFKYINVHGFRHTHATLLTEAGANFAGIQHRLGHAANQNTTVETYVHVTEKIQMDTLNDFIDYMKE